jgi:hypothetical protein
VVDQPDMVADACGRFEPQPPVATVSRLTQNAHPKAKEIYATLPACLVTMHDARGEPSMPGVRALRPTRPATTTQLQTSPNSPKGARMTATVTPPPDPGALSGLVAGLSFIGGIGGANALAPYPRPGASPRQLRQYFTQNAGPTRLNAAGQAISAVSLARFTTAVARLAGRAGRGSRTLQTAAIAGGALAAASLAASAACAAALSGPGGRRDTSAAVLVRREFLAGGVIHTPAFGVLLGALGLAGLRTGELPRPVAVTALVSASACLLAPLYFVAEPLAWFIPAGRFPGLIVTGIAGVQLARGARPRQRR